MQNEIWLILFWINLHLCLNIVRLNIARWEWCAPDWFALGLPHKQCQTVYTFECWPIHYTLASAKCQSRNEGERERKGGKNNSAQVHWMDAKINWIYFYHASWSRIFKYSNIQLGVLHYLVFVPKCKIFETIWNLLKRFPWNWQFFAIFFLSNGK